MSTYYLKEEEEEEGVIAVVRRIHIQQDVEISNCCEHVSVILIMKMLAAMTV